LVWDTRSGAQAAEIRCTSLFWLYAIEFSADGRWLLTTTSDGRELFWQLPGGRLLWSLRTHWQPQWAYLSADARILVTRNPEEAQLWVMTGPGERNR
jgi:WD40 repeat protein